ncbi:MAG: MBL fold metallo-hydrolase [Erysipelotrichaceae bacterium]|nr:MBL fold metallo-hydrolase [Erysipelotrichaceae bacterium]
MSFINVLPIGSGSTGNSIYIEIGDHRILIDMGIGYKKVRDALLKHGRNIEEIDAIFVTHGHYDHVKSASAICNHTSCKVYAEQSSMYPLRSIKAERISIRPDLPFEPLHSLNVTMFSVPHDYVRTCGYIFECGGRKLAYVTDCGKMNEKIFSYISGADVVIIESNHDVEMLKNGPYPIQLQNRILSKFGHLSNEDCASTIEQLYETGSRNFFLAHLSRHNNTPEIALRTTMDRMEGKDVNVYICPDAGDDLYTFE